MTDPISLRVHRTLGHDGLLDAGQCPHYDTDTEPALRALEEYAAMSRIRNYQITRCDDGKFVVNLTDAMGWGDTLPIAVCHAILAHAESGR